MSEVIYRAKTTFKYGAREYHPGEIFEPSGERWDDEIINNLCREERVSQKKQQEHAKHVKREKTHEPAR